MTSRIDPELRRVMGFLNRNPGVRARIPAPKDKTVVYSGGVESVKDVFHAYRQLAHAKALDPQRFDYVTLEERLRSLHVPEFGESLFEHANRVSDGLIQLRLDDQALILWRALSGLYVRGAVGRVRALVLPGKHVARSVFALTEVNVLLRPDVLARIDIDPAMLREFRATVRAGNNPAPIVVF